MFVVTTHLSDAHDLFKDRRHRGRRLDVVVEAAVLVVQDDEEGRGRRLPMRRSGPGRMVRTSGTTPFALGDRVRRGQIRLHGK
jgi:hypothetical protein